MGNYRLNNVVPRLVPSRLNVKSESVLAEDVRRKMRGLYCLRRGVRRIEKSLIKALVLSERRADLKTTADRGKSIRRKLHGARRSGDIAAALRHSAAGIFNKRTDYHISPHRARLASFGKLSVAVVDHDVHVALYASDEFNYLADLVNAQSFTIKIALGALNKYDLYTLALVRQHLSYFFKVKRAVREKLRLSILHSKVTERAVACRSRVTDNLVKRVVGLARY